MQNAVTRSDDSCSNGEKESIRESFRFMDAMHSISISVTRQKTHCNLYLCWLEQLAMDSSLFFTLW
jgi:hypothetical protein